MSKYKLNKRRIRFKIKNLMKAKQIKVIKASGITYIEAIPYSYKDELDNKSLEVLYNSFISLGKELYIKNKDKINKIVFDSHNCLEINLNNSFFNLSNTSDNEENKELAISNWLKNNNLSISDLYAPKRTDLNYLILKNGNWKYSNELYKWLKANFILNINEGENSIGEYIMYDNGFLIDLSIFMYLSIYSTLNQKAIDNNCKETKENIHFNDFLTINGTLPTRPTLFQYILYLNDVINLYELHNIIKLQYIDKLTLDEDNELIVSREFESLYGILWYIFKLNLVDIYSTNEYGSIVSLNICKDCGIIMTGSKLRCDDCDRINARRRKQKSREQKKDNVEKIMSYISKYEFPDYLKDKINIILNTNLNDLKSSDIKDILKNIKDFCIKKGYNIDDNS